MRRARVFFYGLFMDDDLLRAKGLDPQGGELAWVDDVALQIGQRAALIEAPGGRAHGRVVSLTHDELNRLYSEPSVQSYRPEALLAHLTTTGTSIAALCYNLPEPPPAGERSADYVARLREVAQKVGLPADYITSIGGS
jgi:Gamma-glutamyl cyclotransferase, AIG2-like